MTQANLRVMNRRESPASTRNRQPIFERLDELLPENARVLEIGSGTGQHAAYFASQRPDILWQPSDRVGDEFASIEAWAIHERATNTEPPILLDVTSEPWPLGKFDVIYSANMIHIAPFEACLGLLHGAVRHLDEDGLLVLYGPFILDTETTAASNLAFDEDLRARDPRWGIRELGAVTNAARACGLVLVAREPMPANNQLVVFRRAPGG